MTDKTANDSHGSASKGEGAIAAWLRFYKDKGNVPDSFSLSDKLSSYNASFIRRMEIELTARTQRQKPVRVWSAGSGIDHISLMMKAKFRESVDITILDVSKECIAANKRAFEENNLSAEFVVGDLFKTDYSSSFDVVFNTGLLEHFSKEEQVDLLQIFSKSLVPGGSYLTYVPYAGGRIANHCRARMISKHVWPYGPEIPISTLRGLDSGELSFVEEVPMDALDQLSFVRPAYPLLGLLLTPLFKIVTRVPRLAEPTIMKLFGGYGLYAKFVKPPIT